MILSASRLESSLDFINTQIACNENVAGDFVDFGIGCCGIKFQQADWQTKKSEAPVLEDVPSGIMNAMPEKADGLRHLRCPFGRKQGDNHESSPSDC